MEAYNSFSTPLTSSGSALSKNYDFCCAHQHDSEEIANIVNEAIMRFDYFRKKGLKRTSEEEVKKGIEASENCRWYLLKEKSDADKIASVIFYKSLNDKTVDLGMFATRSDARGKELGKALLLEVETAAQNENKKELILWCVNTPRLVQYYENIGFQQSGISTNYDSKYLAPEFIDKISIIEMKKSLTKF